VRPFSVRHRPSDVADATAGVLDVLVVGAGATGAGVALDAASRGLSVAVIDRGDLASGTSSKSSKLIHGGLRYLENYDVGLVYEGVNERQLLQRLAPHLVRPMEFIYPIFPDTARVRLLGLGLTTYDVLAGLRNVRRHERITAEEAVEKAPALDGSGLLRAYLYGDCATDDARLVLANVLAARRFGALALTYTEAVRLLFGDAGRVCGATVADRLDGQVYDLRARHVVNATGVWVDTLLAQEDPSRDGPLVRPSKGVHLVVPHARVPLTGASILMPSRQGDGRSMFAIPWGRQTILGTTDTAYDGPLDVVAIEESDVAYILDACNALFPGELTTGDVVGAWAGCRPLLRNGSGDGTGDLSRRHALSEGPTGLLTITGGKLTTYRRMAKDVVDRVVDRDGRRARCRTDEISLGCARPFESVVSEVGDALRLVGVVRDVEETAETLVRQHGEAASSVLALAADSASLAEPLSPAATHLFAEVVYAARHEGAATLEDVLARRTRLSLRARDAALPAAARAASLLAAETGRDEAWAAAQVTAYEAAVRQERGVLAT
jgi:glycerol-3-phosphate dehydrogenase